MQLMQKSVFDFRRLPDALCNRTHDRMYAAFRCKRLDQILCVPGIDAGEPDILNADTAGEEIILEIGAVDLIVQRDLTNRGVKSADFSVLKTTPTSTPLAKGTRTSSPILISSEAL